MIARYKINYKMIRYPLYDELLRQVNEKEQSPISGTLTPVGNGSLTPVGNGPLTEVGYVCTTINAIGLNNIDYIDHYEEIGAIILYHELQTNANILLTLTPFEAKLLPGGGGVLETLIKLPPLLRKIIIQYIEFYG